MYSDELVTQKVRIIYSVIYYTVLLLLLKYLKACCLVLKATG